MTKNDKQRIQKLLDEIAVQYGNGLLSITEKLQSQINIIDAERTLYIHGAVQRHKEMEPEGSDYRTAHVLLLAHKTFDKALLTLSFAL